jgi:hypothetical protein
MSTAVIDASNTTAAAAAAAAAAGVLVPAPPAPAAGALVPAPAAAGAAKKPAGTLVVSRMTGFGAFARGKVYDPKDASARASRAASKVLGEGKLVCEVAEARTGKYKDKSGNDSEYHAYQLIVRQIPEQDNKAIGRHTGWFSKSPEGKGQLHLYHTLNKDELLERFGLTKDSKITQFDRIGRPADLSSVPVKTIGEGSSIFYSDFSGAGRITLGSIVQLIDPRSAGYVRKQQPNQDAPKAGEAGSTLASAAAAAAATSDADIQDHLDDDAAGVAGTPQSLRGILQVITELPPGLSYSRLKSLLPAESRAMTNMMEQVVVSVFTGESTIGSTYVNQVQVGCARDVALALESGKLEPPFSFVKLNPIQPDALVFKKANVERPFSLIQASGTGYQAIEGNSFKAIFDMNGVNSKKDGCVSLLTLFGTDSPTLWQTVTNYYLPFLVFFASITVKVNQSMSAFATNGEVRDRLIEAVSSGIAAQAPEAPIPLAQAFADIVDSDGLPHFRAFCYMNAVYTVPESLWNLTVPVTIEFLKTYSKRFSIPADERGTTESTGRICDGNVICLSALSSHQVLSNVTKEMEANSEIRVMIGQGGKYAPFVHLLTNLTPQEGADLVASMAFNQNDFLLSPELCPAEDPILPDKYEGEPFNFNKRSRLVPGSSESDTRIVAYAFPSSTVWKGINFAERFDVSAYPKTGRISVRQATAIKRSTPPGVGDSEPAPASHPKKSSASAAADSSIFVDDSMFI